MNPGSRTVPVSIEQMRTVPTICLILVCLCFAHGCSNQVQTPANAPNAMPSDAELLQRTRTHFENVLKGYRSNYLHPEGSDSGLSPTDQYQVDNLQRAMKVLTDAKISEFDHPMLVLATFMKADDNRIHLGVTFLTAKPNAMGIYVQDATGQILSEGTMRTGDAAGDGFPYGLMEQGDISISDPHRNDWPRMVLDAKVLCNEPWVGLVDRDGARGKPIRAFVEPEVLTQISSARKE